MVLTMAMAEAAAQAAEVEPAEDAVYRCLGIRESQPREAIALSESLLARSDLDKLQRIKAFACKGVAEVMAGEIQQSQATAAAMEEAIEDAPELEPGDRLRAISHVGRILHEGAQIHRASEVYERVIAIGASVGGEDATRVQATTFNNIGLIHADFLDSAEAADGYYRQAMELYDSIGERSVATLYNIGVNQLRQGDRAGALETFREAAALVAKESGKRVIALRIDSALAELKPGLDVSTRLARLEAIRRQQASVSDTIFEGITLARMAVLEAQASQPQRALADAERSLELVGNSRTPPDIYFALDALTEVHAVLGNTRQALEYATRKHAMKQQALRQQRMDMLATLQAGTHDLATQLELERMRHAEQIRRLQEQRARTLRTAAIVGLALALLGTVAVVLLQRRRQRQLRILSERDALTGLANRHAATAALDTMATRHPGGARDVLFLVDIDHFKQINDRLGHDAGDRVLVEVAARLRTACGPGDLVSRWGGEEFLVACHGLSPDQAGQVAERLRKALRYTLRVDGGSCDVSASVGLAPAPFFETPDGEAAYRWDRALRMADRALYVAKQRRDAWVGYWGGQLPAGADDDPIAADPETSPHVTRMPSPAADSPSPQPHSVVADPA